MFKRLLLVAAAMCLCTGFLKDINIDKALDAGKGVADTVSAVTISDAEVRKMGKATADELDKLNPVAPASDEYAKRLEKIVANLKKEDGLTLDFKVYLVKDINAFALPDGSVRVFAGLMNIMTDDELFFVIGHEIGHVKNGDSADGYKVAHGVQAARKGADAIGGTAASLSSSQLGEIGEEFINAQFSQSQESAADLYGFNLMKKYKKDTAAAVSALRKLASPGEDSGVNSFFSSHPDPNKRADTIEKLRKK